MAEKIITTLRVLGNYFDLATFVLIMKMEQDIFFPQTELGVFHEPKMEMKKKKCCKKFKKGKRCKKCPAYNICGGENELFC